MFKIAKLEKVNNEKVIINLATQEQSQYENGKKVSFEKFNTLTFDVSGDDYSFGFDLNCKLEKLLEIPMNETIDFKDYILGGETWLNIRDLNGVEPEMDIKITRYLKNRFIIFLTFYTDYSYDENDYSGMIEFTFNLDDYLSGDKKMDKEQIKEKIKNFKSDEEISNFIKERILFLETQSTEQIIGQFYTDTFNDFISSKIHYKSVASSNRLNFPNLVFDDITPYFELIKELSESKDYLNELFLFTPLMMNIFNYLSSKESKSNIEDTLYDRHRLYWDYMTKGESEISIKEFHKQKCGFCSENAGLAHNIFKILGIDSQLVIGKRNDENHAYNIVFPRGYGNQPAVLFDPSYSIDFKMENGCKYSTGYFKVLTIDEYNNMLAGNGTHIDIGSSVATLIRYYPNQLTGLIPNYENASYSIGNDSPLKIDSQKGIKKSER